MARARLQDLSALREHVSAVSGPLLGTDRQSQNVMEGGFQKHSKRDSQPKLTKQQDATSKPPPTE
jgi:hypothetical protein